MDPSEEYTPMKDLKYCFVPTCKNSSRDAQKHFFVVPNQNKKEWCNAVGAVCPKRVLYVCEDHLNLEEDVENYRYWITMKGRAKLKTQLPQSLARTVPLPYNMPMPSTSSASSTSFMEVDTTKRLPTIMKVHKAVQVTPKTSDRTTQCEFYKIRPTLPLQSEGDSEMLEEALPSTQGSTTSADILSEVSSEELFTSMPPDISDSDLEDGLTSESDNESKMESDTQLANEEAQTSSAVQPTIPMLEVCIDSLESAINAIHGGADELEVCSSLTEGGLTPSAGLVRQIMKMVRNFCSSSKIRKSCDDCGCNTLTKRPKVNVMIRCRPGSEFCYSEEEMDTMLSDLKIFKTYGVDRFVFGALTYTQDIDEINCKKIIRKAHPIPVTFHRAFDMCNDPLTAISKIHALGFKRLLTSGQKPSANSTEAIELITSLLNFNDKVQIMPGAGINCDNVETFVAMGCQIVHSSCKRIRYLPEVRNAINMGSSDSECIFVADEGVVRIMKHLITSSLIKEEIEVDDD